MTNEQHVWVRDCVAQARIRIPEDAEAHERFAAEELSAYFARISRAALPVTTTQTDKEIPSIVILDASRSSNRKALKSVDISALKHDGFLIKSVGKNIIITSLEPSGVVYGTYQYLTRVLGVGFHDFGPEGEEIPYTDTVEHGPIDILRNPRLSYRCLQDPLDIRRIDWMSKNGFNYVRVSSSPSRDVEDPLQWWDDKLPLLSAEYRKRGLKIAFGHHIFRKTIPESLYLEDHPEYFPEIDGKRGFAPQFSWSLRNREVIEEVIRRLTDFVSRHPEIDMLDFWPADGIYRFNADDFRAMTGGEEPQSGEWEKHVHGASRTGRGGNPNKQKIYHLLVKPVAEALGRKFPDLKISTLHYVDLVEPLEDVRLPENVCPVPTIYWRCIRHSLNSDECVYNSQFKRTLRKWTELYPDRLIFLYEYYMGMGCHVSLPYPCLTSLFGEWDSLIEMGIGGAHIQSLDTHAVPYNINYLAFAALAWEDAPTMEKFVREYCEGFFKNSADSVYRMYMLWEEGCQQAETGCTQPGYGAFWRIFSDERLQECRGILNDAIQRETDPKVLYRLHRLIILTEYARKALPVSRILREKEMAEENKKSTEKLDRELLSAVEDVVRYARRVKELGADIVAGKSDAYAKQCLTRFTEGIVRPENLIRDDFAARLTRGPWETYLGRLRKEQWALSAFNPNVAEEELARRAKNRQEDR